MDKGLELWKQWFDWDGEPWTSDDYGRTDCFFCGESYPSHSEDCVWVHAKKLLEEQEIKDAEHPQA